MALWTPYAQEVALDLTKRAVNAERVSLLPASAASVSPPVLEPFPLHYPGSQYCATDPYQPASYAAPSSLSPDSVGSWSHTKQPAPSPSTSTEFYESESITEDQDYLAFERDALRAMAVKNGGTLLCNNPRMRRAVQTSQTADDDSYRKQRERNNHAAKMSRERRKLREIQLALRVAYLKKKVADLRAKLSTGVCERCRQNC